MRSGVIRAAAQEGKYRRVTRSVAAAGSRDEAGEKQEETGPEKSAAEEAVIEERKSVGRGDAEEQ